MASVTIFAVTVFGVIPSLINTHTDVGVIAAWLTGVFLVIAAYFTIKFWRNI